MSEDEDHGSMVVFYDGQMVWSDSILAVEKVCDEEDEDYLTRIWIGDWDNCLEFKSEDKEGLEKRFSQISEQVQSVLKLKSQVIKLEEVKS